MAGVRQQRTVRLDKRLDASGRLVEAGGHRGHFIAARHFDPMGQVAGAEMLDPFLQGFEPPSEPAYRRPRTGGHGHEQQHQHHDEAHAASERPPPPWPEVRRAAGAVPGVAGAAPGAGGAAATAGAAGGVRLAVVVPGGGAP